MKKKMITMLAVLMLSTVAHAGQKKKPTAPITGNNILWGTGVIWGDNILWGTGIVWLDNILWGT